MSTSTLVELYESLFPYEDVVSERVSCKGLVSETRFTILSKTSMFLFILYQETRVSSVQSILSLWYSIYGK